VDRYDLKRRTKQFAHNGVKFAASLPTTVLGRHINNQLIRAATSVAVNYRAVLLAQSNAAFAAKRSIVIEEVDECDFWIEFALDEHIVNQELAHPLMNEDRELTAIFIASSKYNSNSKRQVINKH